MESNNIDRLPAELIMPILLELPTTQSLSSLIRASPKSYHVFLASKEKILISLMRRTIQPAALPDALAAIQASQLRQKGPDRKAVLAFLRKYQNKRHKEFEHELKLLNATTAVSLCQLYRSTQYFIQDLASRSTFYLRRCGAKRFIQTYSSPRDCFSIIGENGFDSVWRGNGEFPVDRDFRYAPLSNVEEGRIQRAFYRYELYTQIFSSDMEYNGEKLWELPSDSYFFLKKYQHWEIEELACVANYVRSLLSNSFDRIESNFVGIQLPKPPLNEDTTRFHAHKRAVDLREAKCQIHSLYMDYLTKLSLPFIHHVLQLDRLKMQREMSSHIYYDGQKRSLSTTLDRLWNEISLEDSSLIHNYSGAIARNERFRFKDIVDGPNEGWLCVYGNTHFVSPYRIRDTTQGLGYVFWDSKRLRSAGFVYTP